ncbi:MAG: ATP-binding protein [Phaeodactylibacter sp.]|uniref:ATP-binding protein n=1 Tax=Phaeodactylibacter sp. TaxID=1940289 RepID=UPI0032F09B98
MNTPKLEEGFSLLKYTFVFVLLLVCYPSSGQISTQQFIHFDIADGLPSKVIYSTQQDSTGFIWIATDVGLAYFDGYAFHTMTTKDGLPGNDIIDTDYVNGKLWVNTLGPLSYITPDFKIHQAPVSSTDFSSYIDHQFVQDDSSLWISRYNALFLLDHNSLLRKPVNPSILLDNDTEYWVFEHQSDPWMMRKKKGRKIELLQIAGNQINKRFQIGEPNDEIFFFYQTSKGKYLYCHFNGNIVVINTDTGVVRTLIKGRDLTSQIILNGDQLWIVQPRNGIEIFKLQEDTLAVYQKTLLKSLQPASALQDREGNLWISTLGNGLFFLPRKAGAIHVLQKENGLSENTINSLVANESFLITGNRSNLLEFFEADQNGEVALVNRHQLKDKPNFSITNRILKIITTGPDQYFLATDIGLIHYYQGKEELLLGESIKNLKLGPTGELLISSHKAVWKIAASRLAAFPAFPYRQNPKTRMAYDIEKVIDGRSYASGMDYSGHIWAHTIAEGLMQITPTDTVYWKERDPVFSTQVVDLVILADSTICLGTRGDGLILIKNNQYRLLNQDNLLASDFINVLYKDDRGDLWVGTNKGLSHWPSPSFNMNDASLITYSKSDGLLSNGINDVTVWKDQVFIATNEGLMYFKPSEIIKVSNPPKLVLYPPEVNDSLVIAAAVADLSADENNIRFRFAALNYQDRNTTTFLYRLKGLDQHWQATKTPEVRYLGLQPGSYAFELKAITDKGLESQISTPFYFKIDRPFMQSPIFYWLLIIFGFGILMVLLQNENRKVKNRELNQLVMDKTKALTAQNQVLEESNIKLRRSNQELNQFAYVAAHDLKSPLRNISGFVQLLRRRAKKKLDAEELEFIDFAVKGTQQLEKLIDDLQAYSQITSYAQERTWQEVADIVQNAITHLPELQDENAIELKKPLPQIWINTQNGQLLFYHLLSNASKFRHPDRPLQVKIGTTQYKGQTCFYVRDNGIGIAPEYQEKIFKIFQRLHTSNDYPGTGIGLAICKKIIEEEGGKIGLSSAEGQGATFYFSLQTNLERVGTFGF